MSVRACHNHLSSIKVLLESDAGIGAVHQRWAHVWKAACEGLCSRDCSWIIQLEASYEVSSFHDGSRQKLIVDLASSWRQEWHHHLHDLVHFVVSRRSS